MKIYLVCTKEAYGGNPLTMKAVLKVYQNLENAKERMKKYAEELISKDSNWFKCDTNGMNFIELKYKNVESYVRYYIIEKYLED